MHPTTLGESGHQLTSKAFGPSKSTWHLSSAADTGHILRFAHCHHLEHTMTLYLTGFKSNSQPSCEALLQDFGQRLDLTWFNPWCQKLCPIPPHPGPPHPPPILSHLRGASKSHFQNRCSSPIRGLRNMHSHTCCSVVPAKIFAVHLKKTKTKNKNQNIHIISCHPHKETRPPPFVTKNRSKRNQNHL